VFSVGARKVRLGEMWQAQPARIGRSTDANVLSSTGNDGEMQRTSGPRRYVRFALAFLASAVASTCSTAASASDAGTSVALVVDLDSSSPFGADALRAAVARELGAPVTTDVGAPGGTLIVRERARHVVVSFESPDGRSEARDLDAPSDPDQAVRDVALLAVNLARDQSAEFIRPESPPAPPPPATPTPPPPASAPASKEPSKRPPAQPPPACGHPGPFASVEFDFVPGLFGLRARRASFGLVGTVSAGVDGVALGSAFNVDMAFVCGVMGAGAGNVSAGPVTGGQLAGAINVGARGLKGVQLAGALNIAVGPASGLQGAGAVNFASEINGAQLAGGLNVTRSLRGVQMAGGVNIARPLDGVQMAGGVNVATDVNGAQLAPVNVAAGSVHGAQIGVVNVSTKADFALGIINVATRGRFEVDVWGLPEAGLLLAGVKNGGVHYHYIYGAGLRPTDAHRAWAVFGFGGRVEPLDALFVDVDAVAHAEIAFGAAGRNDLYEARVVVGYRIVGGFALFGGPTYDVLTAYGSAPTGVAPAYARTLTRTSSDSVRGWPGVAVGLEGL
jgi:hypothetical protein